MKKIFLGLIIVAIFIVGCTKDFSRNNPLDPNGTSYDPGRAQIINYVFVNQWGSQGTGTLQFTDPAWIVADSSGYLYVGDIHTSRIIKYTTTGDYVGSWGSFGSGDNQYNLPHGLAKDSSGNLYVTDIYNNRVVKTTSTGSFVTKWGTAGSGDGQFNWVEAIAVDTAGNVYVYDHNNNRIQKFDSTGGFISKWGAGSGNCYGMAVNSSGNIYVSDSDNNCIRIYNTSTGNLADTWGASGGYVFDKPRGIAIDLADNVYVVDRVSAQKFKSTGSRMAVFGTWGAGPGQFNDAYGITIDSSGNLYVTQMTNYCVQKYAPN